MESVRQETTSQTEEPNDSALSGSVLTRKMCTAAVKERFGHSHFSVESWREEALGTEKPMGLLGAHLRVAVDVRWSSGVRETLLFFVKTLPRNDEHAGFVKTSGAAEKELQYYAELQPAMRAALSSAGQGRGRRVEWGARCFLARPGVLVMEDLCARGFRSYSGRVELDYAHAALVIRALAALHAASLAFEHTRDRQLGRCFRLPNHFPDAFKETFYTREEGSSGNFTSSGVAALLECAQELPMCTADPTTAAAVAERLPAVLWSVCDLVQPACNHRNALAHGDLWLNNILFRYDASGQPVDARLVDYQLVRYHPPAFEVFQYLHVCCRRAFRDQHETTLLHEYYAQLKEQLSALGCEVALLLPWKDYELSWEDARLYGRLQAAFINHFVATEDAALADAIQSVENYRRLLFEGRTEHVLQQFRHDPLYRERLTENLQELIVEHVLVDGEDGGGDEGGLYQEPLAVGVQEFVAEYVLGDEDDG